MPTRCAYGQKTSNSVLQMHAIVETFVNWVEGFRSKQHEAEGLGPVAEDTEPLTSGLLVSDSTTANHEKPIGSELQELGKSNGNKLLKKLGIGSSLQNVTGSSGGKSDWFPWMHRFSPVPCLRAAFAVTGWLFPVFMLLLKRTQRWSQVDGSKFTSYSKPNSNSRSNEMCPIASVSRILVVPLYTEGNILWLYVQTEQRESMEGEEPATFSCPASCCDGDWKPGCRPEF